MEKELKDILVKFDTDREVKKFPSNGQIFYLSMPKYDETISALTALFKAKIEQYICELTDSDKGAKYVITDDYGEASEAFVAELRKKVE